MQEQFAGQVEIIGVGGASSSVDDMAEFVTSFGVEGFPNIADLENEVWARYEVRTQPTFVFINDDGSAELSTRPGIDGLTEQIELLIES